MAFTRFATGASQTVKIWSPRTLYEALKKCHLRPLIGEANDKNAIIMRFENLEKGKGDTVYYDLLMQATGSGVTGNARLKDNAEAMVYYQDSVIVNQLRHAHGFDRMSQQRSLHNMRKDASMNLADWYAGRFDQYGFDFWCGNTTRTHGQTAVAPDSTHYLLCDPDVTNSGVIATDEASISDNGQITLAHIDYAKEAAGDLTPPIRPVSINGEDAYVIFIHDYSEADLRLDTAGSAYTSWPEIQLNLATRGKDSMFFKGGLGFYNGVQIRKSNRIYNPTGSVRRAVFCGQQAMSFAFANAYDKIDQMDYGKDKLLSWSEERDDHGNTREIGVGCVFGMKATIFNSLRYGSFILSCYAAKHY